MKKVIYTGSFVSKAGTVYRADIWSSRTADQSRTAVELIFPYQTPVTIEWGEVDKLTPVHSSVATLKIESVSDRQFLELYTVVAGEIGLNVYRSNVLYWSGTLDPELYEEPYSSASGYDVTLNFADFAILDRLDWDQTAFMTPDAIIRYCMGVSVIDLLSYDFKVATTLSDGRAALTNSLINCANFYDEEGEAMTVREVLDETLRPFGLMLRQKAGVIHVCDLHSLSALTASAVVWSSTDSGLSIDKVYSRAVLRFSPYASNTLLEGVVDPSTVVAEQTKEIALNSEGPLIGFYCDLDSSSVGLIIDSAARYFKIRSVRSGEDCSGVAVRVPTVLTGALALPATYNELFHIAEKIYLPTITDSTNYNISVSLDLLYSMLNNPFESAPESVSADYNAWMSSINQLYVPIRLRILNSVGTCLCHYNNGDVLLNGMDGLPNMGWLEGDYGTANECFLTYYSGDWKNGQYSSGWLSNNLFCVDYSDEVDIFNSINIAPLSKFYSKHSGSGDLFPMPPHSGYLEISIGKGILTRKDGHDSSGTVNASIWALYKGLTVGIVGKYGEEISNEDVLLKSKLQLAAKEELSIDTIVGTQSDYVPGARGLLYDAANKSVLTQLLRAGRTDSIERLLLGTLYSNYDRRRIVLSGSVEITSSYGVYSEASTSGKFLQLMEMQTLLEDESEMSMVEFVGDEYDAVLI